MDLGKSRRILFVGPIVALALLLVYTASSLRLDSIHQLFHTENIAELHSAEKEQDPCHKNIYHQQKESGCAHKSHITQNTKCPFCEHNAQAKEILSNRIDADVLHPQVNLAFDIQVNTLSAYIYRGPGRSPPQA